MQGFVAEGNGRFLPGVADSSSWAELGGRKREVTKAVLAASPCPQDGGAPYHTGLFLCVCLLDPAQLRQREDGGDGVGGGELVVAARGPLQLQPWEEEVKPMEQKQPRSHRPRAQRRSRHPAP